MKDTITISTSVRNYTFQGEAEAINELFNHLVMETLSFKPSVPAQKDNSANVISKTQEPMTKKSSYVPDSSVVAVKSHSEKDVDTPNEAEHVRDEDVIPDKEDTSEFDPRIHTIKGIENISFEKLKEYSDMLTGENLDENKVAMYNFNLIQEVFKRREANYRRLKGEEEPVSDKTDIIRRQFEIKDKDGNVIKNPKYRGFVIIECENCHETRSFNAKVAMSEYKCKCGHETPLTDVVPATAICECGKRWRYSTNKKESSFEINCLHCGSPIPLFYNERETKYETVFENEPPHKKNKKGSKK